MTKQAFTFDNKHRDSWEVIKKELNAVVSAYWQFEKSFEVTVGDLKKSKTYQQLRGFHRLLGVLVPYFKEWSGEDCWDKEKVKDFIKKRHGYTVRFHNIEVVKSCKDATIKEMMGLIKEIQKFGAGMDIVEALELRSEELRDLEEFYK